MVAINLFLILFTMTLAYGQDVYNIPSDSANSAGVTSTVPTAAPIPTVELPGVAGAPNATGEIVKQETVVEVPNSVVPGANPATTLPIATPVPSEATPIQNTTGNLRNSVHIKPAAVSVEEPGRDPLITSLEGAEKQLTDSIGVAKAKLHEITSEGFGKPIRVDCGLTKVKVVCDKDAKKKKDKKEGEDNSEEQEGEGGEEEEEEAQ